MDTEIGRFLILWTVRASVALYAVSVWRFLFFRQPNAAGDRVYRITWAMSWLLCVVHVGFAYHFEHRWSQSAAEIHTAEMTARVVGLHWAGGLYVNYVFLTLWAYDALTLFRNRAAGSSSWAMHAVAAFMMFNATVVFGPTWWWIPLTIFVCGIVYNRTRLNSQASPDPPPE